MGVLGLPLQPGPGLELLPQTGVLRPLVGAGELLCPVASRLGLRSGLVLRLRSLLGDAGIRPGGLRGSGTRVHLLHGASCRLWRHELQGESPTSGELESPGQAQGLRRGYGGERNASFGFDPAPVRSPTGNGRCTECPGRTSRRVESRGGSLGDGRHSERQGCTPQCLEPRCGPSRHGSECCRCEPIRTGDSTGRAESTQGHGPALGPNPLAPDRKSGPHALGSGTRKLLDP